MSDVQTLRFEADFHYTPLYLPDSGEAWDLDSDELPLSADLVAAIEDWADRYDATLDQDYPPWSGFPDEAAAKRWLADAADLVRRLRDELPAEDWAVVNAHENQTPAYWVHTRPADA